MRFPIVLLLALGLFPRAFAALTLVDADVCVVGTTSGGVVAAVQAKRLGLRVALVGFNRHLGGLSSGGLGATDVGNAATIGGVSREFYRRVGTKYGLAERFVFEPSVARRVFQEMLDEADITPLYHRKPVSVVMQGNRIRRLVCDDGTEIRAGMFIDATYEGDLLPLAGVDFTWGREANAQYGETLNGIRSVNSGHQFGVVVDPYVVPGNPASGLIPLIQSDPPGTPGEADTRIQAYNYRLCFTQVATNRLPHVQPPGYDPARYELLARLVEARVAAGQSTGISAFFNVSAMPNGKTDMNNNGAVSTDYIGMNYEYPNASYPRRAELDTEHLHYIQGLVWFLANSPRVPAALRTAMNAYGPCRDEWPETGGYSPQIYVREARRLVGDYVVTQRDCSYTVRAPDPVCLGSYNMDSHNCQRYVKNGQAWNEGDVQVGPAGPYGISYRALVPKAGQCANLFQTFAISTSHIAFGSTRMEPVFMMCAHAAADAAALALREGVDVQQVPYNRLAAQLRAESMVTEWNATADNGVVVDNLQAQFTGSWLSSTSKPGFHGSNYQHDENADKGNKTATFRPNLPEAGVYDVYLRWTTDLNRAPAVPVDVSGADGLTTHTVNMLNDNGVWMLLRRGSFAAGTNGFVRIRTTGTTGFVIADAARWVPTNPPPRVVQLLAADADAAEAGPDAARLLVTREPTADLSQAWVVSLGYAGSAGAADWLARPSTVTLAVNQVSTELLLTPTIDTAVEGAEEISVSILASGGITPGVYSNAVVQLRDDPYDAWRAAVFPPADASNLAVSGRAADGDGDGILNEREYALGLSPLVADDLTRPEARWENGELVLRYTRNRLATDTRVLPVARASLSSGAWSAALVETNTVQEISPELDRVTVRLRPPLREASAGLLRLELHPNVP